SRWADQRCCSYSCSRLRLRPNDQPLGRRRRHVKGLLGCFLPQIGLDLVGLENAVAGIDRIIGLAVETLDADDHRAAGVALAALAGVESSALDEGEALRAVVALGEVGEEIDTPGHDRFARERDGTPDMEHARLIMATARDQRAAGSEQETDKG